MLSQGGKRPQISNWQRLIPLVLTLGLLALIVYWFRDEISLDRLLQRIAGADPGYLVLSAILFAVSSAAAVARYKFIIERSTGSRTSYGYLFLLTNFSFACGYLAPVSAAGEVLRLAFTKRYLGIGYVKSARLIILDRLIALGGVAVCSIAFIPFKLWEGLSREFVAVEFLGLVGLFTLIATLAYAGLRITKRISWLAGFEAALAEDLEFIRTHLGSPRPIAILLTYIAIMVVAFGLGTVSVGLAIGFEASLFALFVAAPTIIVAQSAPMLYAGFGAREAILLIAFKDLGLVDATALLSLSLMVALMVFCAALPGAITFLFAYRSLSQP